MPSPTQVSTNEAGDGSASGAIPLTKLKLKTIVESSNLAPLLTERELKEIGNDVVEGYKTDRGTRTEWESKNADAIRLALQVVEAKNWPWENCSNVKFPLLTIAALQFLARISVMTKGRNLAKVEFMGHDADGKKSAQAKRISKHLSLQLVEEDMNWMDSDEQAKLAASILGAAFKKSYNDQISGHNISEHVPAMNFVVDYFCKDIAKARRATHILGMSKNKIEERIRQGLFVEMTGPETPAITTESNQLAQAAQDAEGTQKPIDTPESDYTILEQHCWLDLDRDGYQEPYIVFVRLDTRQTLRIVARFFDEGDVHRVNDPLIRKLEAKLAKAREELDAAADTEKKAKLEACGVIERQIDAAEKSSGNHIVRIDAVNHFTRYLFIPSPDGGVYGVGLGALLGPINASVDSLVNQLIDSGTMQVMAGGFLGRGVKLKGGKMTFDPFEWKTIDSTGDDLRKNIVPLPVRDPSPVLFQLLGMLVQYSEKISGATDIMTGVSPGQNTPAETSRNTVEQGMMLFSGIYGRMYRSFREELRKFAGLNRLYLSSSPQWYDLTQGPNAILDEDDYKGGGMKIFPAASPEAVSASQRREKAERLMAASGTVPGFNRYLVTKNWLEACEYEDIDDIYPDPQGPKAIAPPPNPKIELEKGKLQQQAKEHEDEMQLEVARLKADIGKIDAQITELQAKATKHLAEAQGVETGHQIALIEAQIGAAKARQDGLLKGLDVLQKHMAASAKAKEQSNGNGSGGTPANSGPGSEGMGASPSHS